MSNPKMQYSKLTKIWIFDTLVLSLCESSGVKQPQKMTSVAASEACQGQGAAVV